MMAVQPSSLGTIAMFVPGEHSSDDLSFSVKIQTKSELEILILAMPIPAPCRSALMQISVVPARQRTSFQPKTMSKTNSSCVGACAAQQIMPGKPLNLLPWMIGWIGSDRHERSWVFA
jgi:hypothetical protein